MTTKRNNQYIPDTAMHPGVMVEEYLEGLDMSQAEFAIRTGLSPKTINEIIQGKSSITPATALKFEKVLGRPAHFWNNLEINYQEDKAREVERISLGADIEWLKHIPTKELLARGCVTPSMENDTFALLQATLSFFGVASVKAWMSQWDNPALAARCSLTANTDKYVLAAWVRQGEVQAAKIKLGSFDKEQFKRALLDIRTLTNENPNDFIYKMRTLCATAGVALAFIPEMKKAPWSGATKWLAPNKPLIILSLLGKGEDKFWFTFFHEAKHVLEEDNKKKLSINGGQAAKMERTPTEMRADNYAAETLIPSKYNDEIARASSKKKIEQIAAELDIAPGIVAERYQHLTKNWNMFHGLIRKFKWV